MLNKLVMPGVATVVVQLGHMYTSTITNSTVVGGTTQYWDMYVSAESTHS